MSLMQCQVQNHNGQKIIAVCLDNHCDKAKLCCMQCLESHQTHQKKCVEISLIKNFIEEECNKQIQYSWSQQQIIEGLEKLIKVIVTFHKIIMQKIEMIKQQNLQEYIKKLGNGQQGIEYWNQLLEGILQYVEIDNCVVNRKIFIEGQLNELEGREIKFIKESEKTLESIINQALVKIEKPSQIEINRLQFDRYRKNSNIALINESTVKKTKPNSYAMAYAYKGFDPSIQSYSFAFIIQSTFSDLWVGVGNDDGDNVPSYLFNNFQASKHGQYMICSNNYTLHNNDQEINGKQKGMTFKTGDKIYITYDHTSKMLEFRKQQQQKLIVTMPITDMNNRLYPCVMLFFLDSQVQLVEQ